MMMSRTRFLCPPGLHTLTSYKSESCRGSGYNFVGQQKDHDDDPVNMIIIDDSKILLQNAKSVTSE